MTAVIKKGVGLVVVLFLLWFLFTDPNGAAGMVREIGTAIWDLLSRLFDALSRFLNGLFA
ncbi:hypothetical protein [Nocardioides aequoreus]|uniref:hypothetical protein n=1 Tax=Nocardioides aequoreus TaxID=397278 RepID=UPI0012F6E4A4|nr:hypothetical protein [Nocardioides aequoreus]